ncbi:MAG: ATP synthase F1 subunit gamma [Deltaproteobacteria bacterium]|nr:ATP synthase F1 subunit gamma [Deltaproteobacteria bacterium]
MASLKDIKQKIGGVKKTSQITSAMNMVAASKLRGAQLKMESFRDYAEKFNAAMGNLSGGMQSGQFPLMDAREVKTVELIVVTSDRGLCGSFNSHIISRALKLIAEKQKEGKEVSVVCVGKKGYAKLRHGGLVRKNYSDIMAKFEMYNARTIAQEVADNFLDGQADEVFLIYPQFVSVAVHKPAVMSFLPVQPVVEAETGGEKGEESATAYSYEPGSDEIMTVLQPLYLNVMVYHAMLEAGAGEHAARMTSMDNATKACGDIVHDLTLVYNKARQGSITSELMDIVGGAEALKG